MAGNLIWASFVYIGILTNIVLNFGGPNLTFVIFGTLSFVSIFYCVFMVKDTTSCKKSEFYTLLPGEPDSIICPNEKQKKQLYIPKELRD